MNFASLLTILTLIEERAAMARKAFAQAAVFDEQARTPRLVLNGATNAPTSSQAAQHAQQARHAANLMIGDLIHFAASLQQNGNTDARPTEAEGPATPADN